MFVELNLHLRRLYRSTPKLVSQQRLRDAVDCMLTLQNPDGGFATCEEIRGPKWLDLVNPAEVFGMLTVNVGGSDHLGLVSRRYHD